MMRLNLIKSLVLVFTFYTLSGAEALAEKSFKPPIIPPSLITPQIALYANTEKALISADLKNIKAMSLRGIEKEEQPTYYATAGAPGAAKSTILETFIHDGRINAVYVDPDRVALRAMINTYGRHLSAYAAAKMPHYCDLRNEAYAKWRGGSQYIASHILNASARKSLSIAHGTTSTADGVKHLYANLKKQGYQIVLLLCGATDEQRLKNIQHRQHEQGITQETDADVIRKGKAFPGRFQDYFTHANKIYIYWTENLKEGSVLAAVFSPETSLVVKNKPALERFIETHGPLPIAPAAVPQA